jgi:hypothetical protein
MKKEFEVVCKNCGKHFKVVENEYRFPIKGDKYFCCRSCANTRHHSEETKKKISCNMKVSNRYVEYEIKRKSKEKYICGSKELNDLHIEISKHKSPKYFKKFIPFGLDISKLYTVDFIEEYKKIKSILFNEYVVNCLSPKDIYIKYNCFEYFNNSETLLHVFKDMGFPIRGYSKACINSWIHGKLIALEDNVHYKQQWHTTWNGKEVFLRSSYELDYAEELDKQKIDYDVEALRIKYFNTKENEYRCAIPDFYIPSKNMIIEIKSNWTLDIQEMKDKVKAYIELGYKVKVICDHKELKI